jgi:tricorn protease
LLRHPTLSRSDIVFTFAGDLWSIPRAGGKAKRLTNGPGNKTDAVFSPDGKWIAFTGDYDGNQDVYVIPCGGGTPKRLTYHPAPDQVLGWTPDGRRVLFRSSRETYANLVPKFQRLFTVGLDGDPVASLPLPMGTEAVFSPDGAQVAYVPLERKIDHFRRYRGGRTTPLWIARLSDSRIEVVPHENATDFNPIWIGEKVYFLSDRDGPATLFEYDIATKRVSQVFQNKGLDITSASAGPGAIVYEQFGALHLYHLDSGKTEKVKVEIEDDFPERRAHFAPVGDKLREARLSPDGDRAAFEAWGDILIVDVATSKASNLTRSPGVRERDPAWAPDGKRLAYFSDESGEYRLHIRSTDDSGSVQKIVLGDSPSFYYSPRWSPDGSKIAYIDKRQNIWYVDVGDPKPVKADAEAYFDYFRTFRPVQELAPAWSPDSRWLVYAKHLRNGFGAIFLYSLETGRSTQVTDTASDARLPAFDPDGKYLYFTAATSTTKVGTSRVYSVLLPKQLPTPPAREKQEGSPGQRLQTNHRITVDLEGIGQRVLPLPVSPGNYSWLTASAPGILFFGDASDASPFDPPKLSLHRFDRQSGQTTRYLADISDVNVSTDGRKMLYQQGERWATCATAALPRPEEGMLPTKDLTVWVEPCAAWQQMVAETFRLMRDFFYDPNLHGMDLKAVKAHYRPYVDGLVTRADLNALILQILSELSVSHVKVYGGDLPARHQRARGGLLGADYTIHDGRYRFARVYTGDRLDPGMQAPLAQLGNLVNAGEYLLAVNGQPLMAGSDNVHRALAGTAGKPTVIRVGPDPGGDAARDVTVTPIPNELNLRQWAWIDSNRHRVSDATQGRVGYVYVPHTLAFESIQYALSAQREKEAVIFDERFNLGGDLPDVLMERLTFPLMALGSGREGPDLPSRPGIYGPKVLLINEYAGSGGDALAWYFQRLRLGPLVGKRTWGGLTGAFGTPELMDGGVLEVPSAAIWGTNAESVENRGIAPDVEVEFDPEQVRGGRDPQLEQAIKLMLKDLGKSLALRPRRPAYPHRQRTENRRPQE